MYGRGLRGGPLDAPFCADVTLPRSPPPINGRAYVIGKAISSSQRKTVRRDLESAEAKALESAREKALESARARVGVFLSEASFFHPGRLGFLAETGYFSSPAYENSRRRYLCTVLSLCPRPVDNAGSAAFY